MLKITEPLDSKAGLCDSGSLPGGRALPAWPVPGPAPAVRFPGGSPALPLFCCRWRSRSRWRCPGARGRLRQPHTRVAICFPLHGPSWPGRRWAWGQARSWGGFAVRSSLSELLVVPGGLGWATCRVSDQPSWSAQDRGVSQEAGLSGLKPGRSW